jgi:hypothetical protein
LAQPKKRKKLSRSENNYQEKLRWKKIRMLKDRFDTHKKIKHHRNDASKDFDINHTQLTIQPEDHNVSKSAMGEPTPKYKNLPSVKKRVLSNERRSIVSHN